MADRALQNFVNGKYVDASDGRTSDVIDPSTGEVYAQAPVSGRQDVDAAMQAAASRVRGMAGHHPVRAQPGPVPDRRRDREARRRHRRGGDPQHRQAGRADGLGGDPARGGPDPVLRRRRPGARGPQRGRVHEGPHLDDPARADRRVRPGDAVELPDDDGGLEVRARHRGGQHGRAQALRHHPGLDAAAGRDRGRVPAARRVQRGLRRPRHRPRAGLAPHAEHGVDHRLGAGRHGGRPHGRRRPQAGAPRARRQGAGRRLRRRRHRGHRGGHRRRRLLQRRAGLHRGDPGAGRPGHRRRPDRGAGRAGRQHHDRRARRARRLLRPAEQPEPAGPGRGHHRAHARPRRGRGRRPPGRASAATSTRPPSCPACSRTTR